MEVGHRHDRVRDPGMDGGFLQLRRGVACGKSRPARDAIAGRDPMRFVARAHQGMAAATGMNDPAMPSLSRGLRVCPIFTAPIFSALALLRTTGLVLVRTLLRRN